MNDRPPSPFAGLDRALLRSTRAVVPVAEAEPGEAATASPQLPSKSRPRKKTIVRDQDEQASKPARERASTADSKLASYPSEIVESIRRTVKVPGRDVSFVRLTASEKARLAEVVYAYKKTGRKTTETEINRIAVNFILEDYERNGEESVLAKVLAAPSA